MVIFTIKLIKNIRKAFAGRNHPHQMAWAVALGVLLGIVPHGNLLAFGILLLIIAVQINHALAAVTTIGVTFLATQLDPVSSQLGGFVLSHERFGPMLQQAWQYPLVPWTDLNNSVVLGSFLLGVGALLPIYGLTYPVFKMISGGADTPEDPAPEANEDHAKHSVVVVDNAHPSVPEPHVRHEPPVSEPNPERQPQTAPQPNPAPEPVVVQNDWSVRDDFEQQVESTSSVTEAPENATVNDLALTDGLEEDRVAVDTRIDVIRMTDYRKAVDESPQQSNDADDSETEQPMDEALSYLLRQLRDSQQQRKAG